MDYQSIVEAGISGDINAFSIGLSTLVNSEDILAYIKLIGRLVLSHYARLNKHIEFEPLLKQLIDTVITLINKDSSPDIVTYIGMLDIIVIYQDNYCGELLDTINRSMYAYLFIKYDTDTALEYIRDSIYSGIYSLAIIRETNTPLLAMNKLLYGLPYGSYKDEADLFASIDADFATHIRNKINTINAMQSRIDKRKELS